MYCLADHLISYLSVVGEAAPGLPLFYYHIPSMTGVDCELVSVLFSSIIYWLWLVDNGGSALTLIQVTPSY